MTEPLSVSSSWGNDVQTTSATFAPNNESNTHFIFCSSTDVTFPNLHNDAVSDIIDKLESVTRQRLFLTSKAIGCRVKLNTYSLNFDHMHIKKWYRDGSLCNSYIENALDRVLNSTNFDKVRIIRINVSSTVSLPPHAIIENLDHKFTSLFKNHIEWIIIIGRVGITLQRQFASYMMKHPPPIENKKQIQATYDHFQAISHYYNPSHQLCDLPMLHTFYENIQRTIPGLKFTRSSDVLNVDQSVCREYKTKATFYSGSTNGPELFIKSRLRTRLSFLTHTRSQIEKKPTASSIKHSVECTINRQGFEFMSTLEFMSKHARDFKIDSIYLTIGIESCRMISSMTTWMDVSKVKKLVTFETDTTIHHLAGLANFIKLFVNIDTIRFVNIGFSEWKRGYCMSRLIKHECDTCNNAMSRFIDKVGHMPRLVTTREKIDEVFSIIHEAIASHVGKE